MASTLTVKDMEPGNCEGLHERAGAREQKRSLPKTGLSFPQSVKPWIFL